MGYYCTTSPENVVPGKSWVPPKTHTPGSPVKERGHRYYVPESGRWVNRDPMGERGGVGLNIFVHNAPTVIIDPTGLKTYSCTVHPTWGPIVDPFPTHRYITIGGPSYGLYPGGVHYDDGPATWPAPKYWIWCSEVTRPKCLSEAEFDAKMLEAVGESDQNYSIPMHMCIQWASEVISAGNAKALEEVNKKKAECLKNKWKWQSADDPKDCCYCADK